MLPDSLKTYSSEIISKILIQNHHFVLSEFYEMQNNFLSARYKMNKSIETSNILTLLGKNLHLEIVRQRERDLDFDISLANFFKINNFMVSNDYGSKAGIKIVSIVKDTGIPKETVRRKLKTLIEKDIISFDKENKLYYYNLPQRNVELYQNFIDKDINGLAKFVLSISKCLGLNLKLKFIENEIKSQFSFYYYHYYNCQLAWMRMWQKEINDVDLIFITIQALIPALKYTDINTSKTSVNNENFYSIIGKANLKYRTSDKSINASSISEVSGIPRATCIRKLHRLVKLGMLVKETKTKRYYINQSTSDRTKFITKKENVKYTVNIFCEFLSVIVSALTRKK